MKSKLVYFIIWGMICISSCDNFGPDIPEPLEVGLKVSSEEMHHILDSLPFLDQSEIIPPELLEETETRNSTTICETKRMKYAEGGHSIISDPRSDILYPGVILYGRSLIDGTGIPYTNQFKSLTYSVSGITPESSSTTTFKPSLSAYRDFIREKVYGNEINVPANIFYETNFVHSHEDFLVSIRAYANSFWGKISGDWFRKENVQKTRIVVKFYQLYFSVDVDVPTNPVANLLDFPSRNNIGEYNPIFLSSANYGRMVIFLFESTNTGSQFEANLNASVSTFFASGGIGMTEEQEKILKETSIRALIIGGSGEIASKVVAGVEGLRTYIANGGKPSLENMGAPLSYSFRYLKDGSLANVVLGTEYTLRDCHPIPVDVVSIEPLVREVTLGKNEDKIKHMGGDPRIEGKDVFCSADAQLFLSDDGKELLVDLYFKAEETYHDYSRGIAHETLTIWEAPKGKKIRQIVSSTHQEYPRKKDDNGSGIQEIEFDGDYPFERIEVAGRTDGLDSKNCGSNCSFARFIFNRDPRYSIKVELIDED